MLPEYKRPLLKRTYVLSRRGFLTPNSKKEVTMKPTIIEIESAIIPPPPPRLVAKVLDGLQIRIKDLTLMTAPSHPDGHKFTADKDGKCTKCSWISANGRKMKCGKHTLRDHALQALEQFTQWEKDLQDPETSGGSMLEILLYVNGS